MRENWAQRWPRRVKIAPAIAALIVNVIIGYVLIMGLRAAPLLQAIDDAPLTLFNLEPPAELKAEPEVPEQVPKAAPEGGSSAGLPPRVVEPTADRPAVAPAPVIVVPAPIVPAVATPAGVVHGEGSAGMGGTGDGSGAGGSGGGAGAGRGGGDGGAFSRAKQIGGRFRNSDFPDGLAGVGRVKIGVRYAISPAGRVDQCEIIEKSGYAEVDAMTCRVIMERYRFRPARDPDGYAVTEVREEDYRWRVR